MAFRARSTEAPQKQGLGDLVVKLPQQIIELFKAELQRLKSEVTSAGKGAGIGAVALVVAAVLALYMLGWLFASIFHAFNLIVPEWAASLITAGILLLLAAGAALFGLPKLKKGMEQLKNPEAMDAMRDDINMIKGLGNAADGTEPVADYERRRNRGQHPDVMDRDAKVVYTSDEPKVRYDSTNKENA